MTNTDIQTDVAIIGAGPVGLFAIFECGMLKMKAHVVDALDEIGGQCQALYPEKPIYDIAGFPEISGEDLIKNLEVQAEPFGPVFHLGQQVEKLDGDAKAGFRLQTSKGTVIKAKAIIIAAGVGAFGPNRPPLDGIEDYEGQGAGEGINYLVKRRSDFKGKAVVIAGGGDSAVDWALSLEAVAKRVSIVHRRPKFRAAPESAARLAGLADDGKIDIVTPYQLSALEGSGGKLGAVVVSDLDGNKKTIPADVLLPFFGLKQELGPIADWSLGLEHFHIKVDPASMESERAGIFGIGDVVNYPGKLKLILTGFAEAARAAHSAHAVVHPGEALHFEYSTSKGVPGS